MDEDELSWEVLARDIAYSCPGFDIIREDVRLPSGVETDYDYLSAPPSVVVLPFTPAGEMILIREWREAVSRVNWGFPVGTVDEDDDRMATTAARELREETGYQAGIIEHFLTVEPANGVASIEYHYFVAEECERIGDQSLEDDETIVVERASYEDVLASALSGTMRDGRSLLGLLYYHATQ